MMILHNILCIIYYSTAWLTWNVDVYRDITQHQIMYWYTSLNIVSDIYKYFQSPKSSDTGIISICEHKESVPLQVSNKY